MRGMASTLHVVAAGSEVIEQSEIETLYGFQNQIRALERIVNEQSAALLRRLLAGSPVEPGTHTAEIEQQGGTIRLEIH